VGWKRRAGCAVAATSRDYLKPTKRFGPLRAASLVGVVRLGRVIALIVRGNIDPAIEAMLFAGWSGGEEQRVYRLVLKAIAKRNAPQAIDLQRPLVGSLEPPDKRSVAILPHSVLRR
jgi:hypothetical protein